MMTRSEIPAIVRDCISQFGFPDSSNSHRFISRLNEILVQNPAEAKILEFSLSERIPERLYVERDHIQVVFPHLANDLSQKYRIDYPAADWVVRLWMDVLRITPPAPFQQQQYQQPYQQSYSQPIPPVRQGMAAPSTYPPSPPAQSSPGGQSYRPGNQQQPYSAYTSYYGNNGQQYRQPSVPFGDHAGTRNRPPQGGRYPSGMSSLLLWARKKYRMLIVVGSVICLISLFLPAFTIMLDKYALDATFSGSGFFFVIYAVLIVGVGGGAFSEYSVKYPYYVFAIGFFLFLFTLSQLIFAPGYVPSQVMGIFASPMMGNKMQISSPALSYGFFLELLGTVLITVGGYFDYYYKTNTYIDVTVKKLFNQAHESTTSSQEQR